MKKAIPSILTFLLVTILSCTPKKDNAQFQAQLQSLDLRRGEITLCGSEEAKFGKVSFGLSCAEIVQADFNLATALLHSFEYTEAEKVFAKIIDQDPECLMAYWGAAMSNFHPLWAPPTQDELRKGVRIIEAARSVDSKSTRESDYLEAVATIFDNWQKFGHRQRLLKFEQATKDIYDRYADDKEAAIFYALALRAASDPADKTFAKQKQAGEILKAMFPNEPNHPGIAHYLIHTYDYPELADLALPAARKYASIAATSAHALHMPSHIFTRLGLWDESIQSNINSMSAAKCYAENSGIKGHWDEEIHGLDYLVYAYLQQGKDDLAKQQLDYLSGMEMVFPQTNKIAYTFASVPARYALERKQWKEAANLRLNSREFPWNDFPWERSIINFARVLGSVHTGDLKAANKELETLKANYSVLVEKGKAYEANQVMIQIKASEGWIKWAKGKTDDAIKSMLAAAEMEDATEKHPVTPGEVVPARELLGDMYLEMKQFDRALEAYESDLQRHPGRFNALYGAALAARQQGNNDKATTYFRHLLDLTVASEKKRPEIAEAQNFLNRHSL